MAASKFMLMLRIRFRYLLYSAIAIIAHLSIGSQMAPGSPDDYLPGIGLLSMTTGEVVGWVTSGFVAIKLFFQGTEEALDFYTHNKIGSGRVARAFFKHRDVVQMSSSVADNWRSTLKYSFYMHVIPYNLYGLSGLVTILLLLVDGFSWHPLGYAVGFFLLAKLSQSFADNHLCDDEVKEMYERPDSYANVVTEVKQEIRERQAIENAQKVLSRERRRNRPLPPQSRDQYNQPRKPY